MMLFMMIIINKFFKHNIQVLFLILFLKNLIHLKLFKKNIKNIDIENIKELLRILNLYFCKI